jgi:hypothetical protein
MTLMRKAICLFETSVAIYQLKRSNVAEDLNVHQHDCENFRSRKIISTFANVSKTDLIALDGSFRKSIRH